MISKRLLQSLEFLVLAQGDTRTTMLLKTIWTGPDSIVGLCDMTPGLA